MNFVIKKCRDAIGYKIHDFKNRNRDPDAEFNDVLKHLIPRDNPTIIDIGAHRGESIKRFKTLFPHPVIHAFEPDEENFTHLSQNCATLKNLTLNNAGASDKKGKLTFYRNLKSNTSSFNPVNQNAEWTRKRSAQRGVSPAEYTQKTYDVDIIDLDTYISDHKITHIDLLKIDTQGHEDTVLDGCKKALKNGLIQVIETELIVGDAYEKKLSFSDIESRLLQHGYEFYAIDSHGNLKQTPWLSFNLIYVHKKLLNQFSQHVSLHT